MFLKIMSRRVETQALDNLRGLIIFPRKNIASILPGWPPPLRKAQGMETSPRKIGESSPWGGHPLEERRRAWRCVHPSSMEIWWCISKLRHGARRYARRPRRDPYGQGTAPTEVVGSGFRSVPVLDPAVLGLFRSPQTGWRGKPLDAPVASVPAVGLAVAQVLTPEPVQ